MKNLNIGIIVLGFLFMLGCGQSEQQKQEEANEYLKQARQFNFEGKWNEAIASAEACIEIDKENAEAYFLLGNAYFNKDNWESSLFYYDKAIVYDSTYADAYSNRGNVKFYLNDKDGACADYKKADALGKPNMSDKLNMCF